jgi:hypothetical protein
MGVMTDLAMLGIGALCFLGAWMIVRLTEIV